MEMSEKLERCVKEAAHALNAFLASKHENMEQLDDRRQEAIDQECRINNVALTKAQKALSLQITVLVFDEARKERKQRTEQSITQNKTGAGAGHEKETDQKAQA